jgi:inner membrane protein
MGKSIRSNELNGRVLLLGVTCSILPDFDVIGFNIGIRYGDLWGHRGLTHSLVFAALLSGTLVTLWYRQKPAAVRVGLFWYFFFSTASHGVLDAMTNGGLGVAFFSPFDTTRYFFTLRPIPVSPIGVYEFFTEYGLQVLLSEVLWIWFPSCALCAAIRTLQRIWTGLRSRSITSTVSGKKSQKQFRDVGR